MAYADRDRRQEQAASASASLILGAGLFASLLLAGQTAQMLPDRSALPSISFDIAPPPAPPPPPEAERERAPNPEGASAPPAKRAAATQITAPKPKILIERPNPAPAAPVQGPGNETRSGATDRDGPGTGAGGQGMGTGSGNSGLGMGGGGGKARHVKGRIRNGDYPKSASRDRQGGSVTVWYTVKPDGRVTNCAVRISSGNADLDSTTCRLIEKRFRYEPARDANGRAVASETGWRQDYWLEAPDWGG